MSQPKKTRRGRHEGGVQKLPSGSYRVTLSLGKDRDGKRIRESVTAPTKGEALEAARKRMAELGPADGNADRTLTLGAWLAGWMQRSAARVAEGTQANRASRARKVERAAISAVPLAKLRLSHVAAWLDGMEAGGVPAGQRAAALSLLRQALSDAVRAGRLASSPADKAVMPRAGRADRRSLSPEEARAVLAAAGERGMLPYVLLALDSGCRPGELLALRRRDLDGRTLHVRRNIVIVSGREKGPKTAAGERRVLLAPGTAALLARAVGPEELLIARPACRGPYKDWLRPALRVVYAAAGVPWAVPYTTRHTCATLLLRDGVPITAVAQRLGHRDASITLRCYCHALPGDQGRAAEAAARLFGG
jgi:integrase